MLTHVYLLALVGCSISLEIEKIMPSRHEIEGSINRTINEVEKLIEENPTLPKLSRSDIVSILYNITSKDMSSIEDETLNALQKMRADYQRALMVVLPYKLKNSENLNDLYTKPPMVQLLTDEESDQKADSKIEFAYNPSLYSGNSATVPRAESLLGYKSVENLEITETPAKISFQDLESIKAAVISDVTREKLEPQKFNLNLDLDDQRAEASHTSIATKRPLYKGTFSRYRTSTQTPPRYEIIYTTSTTTPKPTTSANLEKTTPQNKLTQDVLSSDQWHYYAPPTATTDRPKPLPDSATWKPKSTYKIPFLPTAHHFSDDSAPIASIRPTPIFVTPVVTIKPEKIPSNITTIPSAFKTVSTTTTTSKPTPMREEVELLLKSIGLEPMKPTDQHDKLKVTKNADSAQPNTQSDDKVQNPKLETVKTNSLNMLQKNSLNVSQKNSSNISQNNSFNSSQKNSLNTSQNNALNTSQKNSLSTTQNNSFQFPSLVVKDDVKNLSPDIKLLFQQFGLQMPTQKEESPATTSNPSTTASFNSYTHFKPLPTSPVKDKDFRNFLSKFGLGIGDNRSNKAMQAKPTTKRPSLLDAVPESMKKILENIGIIRRAPPKVESKPKPKPKQKIQAEIQTEAAKTVEQSTLTTVTTDHIFKPSENTVEDEEQNKKIKNLLNTVRMVQEGRANVQAVQDVANELLQNTKSLGNGPDPVKLEELLSKYRENLKNEVKRQPAQQLVASTSATTSTSRTTSTRTRTITNTNTARPTTEDLDETTLSFMGTTDSSGSFSDFVESPSLAAEDESRQPKTDQSPSSPTDSQKAAKPSFFDTFDVSDYLDKTDTNDSSSTASPPPASSQSGEKPGSSFFDTFDVGDYINKTTDEDSAKNANVSLSDLEASFGGSTAEPDPVIPTRPKTGLYFLVDWNTFLEVGEEGKEKVNLRFSPKVGDRTRFISVKMP